MNKFFELDPKIQADKIMETIENRKKNRTPLLESKPAEDPFIDLFWKINEVRENNNPIPIPENVPFRFIKRVIGKLIRTFTRKQVHFNQSTTAYLELVLHHFRQLQTEKYNDSAKIQYLEEKIRLLKRNDPEEFIAIWEKGLKEKYDITDSEIKSLSQKIKMLEEHEIYTKYIEQVSKMNEWTDKYTDLNDSYRKMNEWIKLLSDRMDRAEQLGLWLKSVEESHRNLYKWVELISERTERTENYQDRIRKELFAELKYTGKLSISNQIKEIAPSIINKNKYQKMINENNIKVNLGSGTLTENEYLNVDIRELPGVDVIADARKLPFAAGSITELYLAHIIEHFSEAEMAQSILPHWHSLIKKGGKIRVICPNWKAMLDAYASGEINYDVLKEVTFGSQEYEGNFHYNMFTPETLTELLSTIGFVNIKVVAPARLNGLCLEMELEGERV